MLLQVHHALGHKYAEAVDIRDEAVACAARLREELTKAKDQCNDAEVHSSSLQQELSEARDQRDEARGRESSSQEGLNEAVKQIATMQQNLAAIMVSCTARIPVSGHSCMTNDISFACLFSCRSCAELTPIDANCGCITEP